MAKRITKKPAKKPTAKRVATKKPNTKTKRVVTKKVVNSPAARKRNPKTGSVKRVQQRRQTAADRLKKPLTKPLKKPLTKSLNSRGSQRKPVNKTVNKSTNKTTFPTQKASRFKLPGGIGKAITLGTLLTTGAMSMMKKKDPTFGEAFNKARKDLGPNAVFPYKGKKYSTVTKDQVKKAGYNTLREYLNAGGKKKTSVKKPMKRKTGPRNRR